MTHIEINGTIYPVVKYSVLDTSAGRFELITYKLFCGTRTFVESIKRRLES